MPLGDLGKGIRDALVGTITGAGDVMEATVDASRRSTVKALGGVRDVSKEVTGIAADSVTGLSLIHI